MRIKTLVGVTITCLALSCGDSTVEGSSAGDSDTTTSDSSDSDTTAGSGSTSTTSATTTTGPTTSTTSPTTSTTDPTTTTSTTEPATTDPATTDPATTDPTTGEPVDPVPFSMRFAEFASAVPVVDATVTIGQDAEVTDGDGIVHFLLPPDQDFTAAFVADGYPDYYYNQYMGSAEANFVYAIPNDASIGLIEQALAVPLDPTKSVVIVSVSEYDPDDPDAGFASIPDVTVELDAPYDLAVVSDADAIIGMSPGNTTLAGSNSWVIFINVDAADVTPDITLPGQVTCNYGVPSFDTPADAFINTAYFCQ